jgi:hypothetical protein
MKKYFTKTDWLGRKSIIRRVNQDEIATYIKQHPGKTENQIMFSIYGYSRSSGESNKKYADCLRRALRAGKISRILVSTSKGKRYIYFVSGE